MKILLTKLFVFAIILGRVSIAAAEPKIVGKTVEYSAQGVMMNSGFKSGVLALSSACLPTHFKAAN